MKIKKVKSIMAVILCAFMTLSLGACSGSAKVSSTNHDYSKPLKISFASVQVADGVDYTSGDALAKAWCEKFNISWDISSMTWDNWAEKSRVWINAGDMPDMETWNYVQGEAAGYADQGMVKKLPDNWQKMYPNLAKAFTESGLGPKISTLFKGTYFLPKPIFSLNKPVTGTLPSHMDVYFRKDWAEAVGFPIKEYYKTSELMQFARLVKAKDPGHIGSKLTEFEVQVSNMGVIFPGANSTNCTQFYYDSSTKQYKWGGADQATLTGLNLYSQAYREGLIDPEYYTLKGIQDEENFYIAGTAAMTCDAGEAINYDFYAKQIKKNLNLDPDKVLARAFVIGEDGNYHMPEVNNFWTTLIFNPNISSEKLSRIMDMLDYSCTRDVQNSFRLGIKGTDWTESSDGTLQSLMPAGTAVDDKYKSIEPVYGNMYILSDDFDFVNPNFSKAYRDNTKKLYQDKAAMSTPTSLLPTNWNIFLQDTPERSKTAFDYGTEYAQLILKSGNIETNWQAWVKDKMQLVQPVLNQLNAAK